MPDGTSEIFLQEGLDDPNHAEMLHEIAVLAHAILRVMAAMTLLAAVDQPLRKAPAVPDATGTPDDISNLGGVISWIKSLSASVSNGLRSILKFEGAVFSASL